MTKLPSHNNTHWPTPIENYVRPNDTTLATGRIVYSLDDGIHQVRIPATISGEEKDQIHVFIKDDSQGNHQGYLINLGTFVATDKLSSTKITAKTIEKGNFIYVLEDGIVQLNIDGKAFPDSQARTFSIVKDGRRVSHAGYATVLKSSLAPQ